MTLPAIIDSSRRAYAGMSGSGKSHAAKLAVTEFLKTPGARVVVIDPEDEWSKLGKVSKRHTLGPCDTRASFEEVTENPGRYLDGERVALAVTVADDDDEASEQVAALIEVFRTTGELLIVFEECGHYAGPEVSNRAAAKAMSKVATRGRHWGCPSVYCAQRLVQIPPSARAQLDGALVFRQVHPADLDALKAFTNATGARVVRRDGARQHYAARELIEQVPQLADWEFAAWTARGEAK